ncbi:hypothetical protein Lwal_3326 [Legionella waltersii]|uniref:Uncharacterized protein n=2 Tax=Legionella waltersii TaxID=66969 RepID=A0A0W1A1L9_9GAMM|nr:hypothetical protein Lwal_3326 [Legionella waltersii]SNV06928.1 Uncharacterised protein [Legionella waltersii]
MAIILFFFVDQLYAGSYKPQCPKEINALEHIQTSVKGWETLKGIKNNFLSSISFYSGHPKQQASLKPNSINSKQAKWSFSPNETIYILCQYNKSGIELTQQLRPKTKNCTVLFNPHVQGDQGYLPKEIQCTD